ncbi:hypothetical protein [Candidatus Methylopumilus planktonicus]|uniref:hypothetical protein n=1 Tax=Candidatus Methylopumilus planktonicus TaxID=1581557 RepID=UPI003BEF0025
MQLIDGMGGEKLDVLLNLLNMNTHKLFSAELNKALRLKYKSKSISALYFATQFNKQCKKTSLHISQESARKWLKGLSFPNQERIMVLILWLKLEDLQASDADDTSQSIIADQAKVLKETLIKMTTKLLELIKTIR